jgi:endonuclease G
MDYFPVPRLREFREAAMSAGVGSPEKRDLLLAGIDRRITGGLKIFTGPRDQLYGDLVALNSIERVADGSVPLLIWLDNAEDLAKPLQQAAVFAAARREVAERTEVHSVIAPVEPAAIPEEAMEITPPDGELPVSFLPRGYEAAKSVAKLLVRRYDSSLPAKIGSGEPLVYSATAWLLTPDLLITGHHVISARDATEPGASADDLRLQVEHSVAQFDFDADTDEGLKLPILRLETFDPALDYAILRVKEHTGRRGLSIAAEGLKTVPHGYISVNLIQHANARRKTISMRNNVVMSATRRDLRFFFETHGSGGSPVLDDQWRVLALYRGKVFVENVRFQGRPKAFVGFGTHILAIFEHIKANNEPLWQEIEHGILYR